MKCRDYFIGATTSTIAQFKLQIQNEFIIVFMHLFYFFGIDGFLYHPAPFGNDMGESNKQTCGGRGNRRHFIYITDDHYTPQVWDK
jgi:hypothetical protein